MSSAVAVAADLLVAVLLVASIVTSVRLSRRMAKLRADEGAMRATIGELLVATDTAERAIASLRAAVQDSERALTDRLDAASHRSGRLAAHIDAGEDVLARVAQMADANRRVADREPMPPPPSAARPAPSQPDSLDPLRATILAVRDVAARSARRLHGEAA